jgi:protoporphyrinogen oxidase
MNQLTILGGGPAGLGAAFYANRAKVPFVLFERSGALGGMCRTFRHGEHSYDSGAHRFHARDSEITRDLVELMGDELVSVNAPSIVWDHGRFIDFPPTPLSVLSSYPLKEVIGIGFELLGVRLRPQPCVSFQDFAISQFGETLSRRILLNYSEKLWGLPADQLSPDVATRRLSGMTLRSLFFELLMPGKKTTHIDGSFLYPRHGYGRIADSLASKLPVDSICVGHEVEALECSKGRVTRIRFADGEMITPAGRILSTLPLTLLVKLLGDELSENARRAAGELRFRHVRLIFIRLGKAQLSPNASIYIPDPEFCISRLYEPKNRSSYMAPDNETSLVVEVPCFSDDPIDRLTPDELGERVVSELVQLSLISRAEVIEWKHHYLANAYPLYTRNYAERVTIIRDALKPIVNLDTIGRAGLFQYSHLHDQLRFAKDYVDGLLSLDGPRLEASSI